MLLFEDEYVQLTLHFRNIVMIQTIFSMIKGFKGWGIKRGLFCSKKVKKLVTWKQY